MGNGVDPAFLAKYGYGSTHGFAGYAISMHQARLARHRTAGCQTSLSYSLDDFLSDLPVSRVRARRCGPCIGSAGKRSLAGDRVYETVIPKYPQSPACGGSRHAELALNGRLAGDRGAGWEVFDPPTQDLGHLKVEMPVAVVVKHTTTLGVGRPDRTPLLESHGQSFGQSSGDDT